MKEDLAALQGEWQKAREQTAAMPVEGKPKKIPDGKWFVIVENATLGRAQDKQPKLTWVLLIQNDGEFKGRRIWYNKKITVKSLVYVMKDLKLCGVDVPNLEEIAAYLPQVRGVELEITYSTKGEYRDVYFNKRLSDGTEFAGEIETSPDGHDAPIH